MIDIVGRWRKFERMLHERGLDWGLNYAPAQLRYLRSSEHPLGARLDHLLPGDYRAFIAEVGYPVVGFRYYDRNGFSFLPPEAMARLSVYLSGEDDVWPEAIAGEPTVCLYAFFAGYDLSDMEGYAFGPANEGGELAVYEVERGGAHEVVYDTFTEWLDAEISQQEARIAGLDDAQIAQMVAENEGEDDPHRLLNYSLDGSYDQDPYSAEDLELAWVQGYGLVDGGGAWLIPAGKRFREVRPFRDGVAEVVLNDEIGYGGPWVRIRPDGSLIDP